MPDARRKPRSGKKPARRPSERAAGGAGAAGGRARPGTPSGKARVPARERGLTGPVAGPVTMLFLIGLMLLLAYVVVDTTRPGLEIALGDRGTPGTAEVLSCEDLGEGRYDCDARFTFDDPAREPIVIDTVPDAEAGEVFPAALTPEGDRVVPTGERGVWASVGLLALVPLCVAFIPVMVLYGFGIRRGRRAAMIGAFAVSALALLTSCTGLILGS
ncbi:hypothetical protein Plo01_70810 [Planobispora longispora]|uniref:Uncharacterized protein n=2 Tax=Planobispora longispora TaxID=28887 RepID=A0A8J3RVF6_9ACTN|nr:hypothetical protein Plo01_70810 [Planobispora longispora]